MLKTMHRLFNHRGQAMVETALVLPFILMLLVGIFEFGMIFNNWILISNGAREGARQAAIGANDTTITNAVKTVTASLEVTAITVTITPEQSQRTKGNQTTVQVQYTIAMVIPIIGDLFPEPIKLTSTSVMRVE